MLFSLCFVFTWCWRCCFAVSSFLIPLFRSFSTFWRMFRLNASNSIFISLSHFNFHFSLRFSNRIFSALNAVFFFLHYINLIFFVHTLYAMWLESGWLVVLFSETEVDPNQKPIVEFPYNIFFMQNMIHHDNCNMLQITNKLNGAKDANEKSTQSWQKALAPVPHIKWCFFLFSYFWRRYFCFFNSK